MLNNKPRPKEDTKCVSAAGEELTAAKHKLKLIELKLFRDVAAAHMKDFEQQKRDFEEMRKKDAEREKMYEKMRKFMEGMNVGPNIPNRGKREQRPRMYRRTPYVEKPPTTVLPKQCGNKSKNKVNKAIVLPLNLGNVFYDDNEGRDDIMFLGGQFTGNILVYKNVNPNKTGTGEPNRLVVWGRHVRAPSSSGLAVGFLVNT
nr:hypothetical protein [Tanacetum cinerariifolium]